MAAEVDEVRGRIRATHGVRLRYVIWAGMGGSVEDKTMYNNVGLLRGGLTFYALDSTDPAKLKAILADIERRARRPLREALRSTLVVGMALGMTSYEPVVNLEKLSALYDQLAIDSAAELSVSHAAWFAPRSIRRAARLSPGRAPAGRRSHDGRAS